MAQNDHPMMPIRVDLARAMLAYLGECAYAEVKVIADALGGGILEWEREQRARMSALLSQAATGAASDNGASVTESTNRTAVPVPTDGGTAPPGTRGPGMADPRPHPGTMIGQRANGKDAGG